MYTQNEEFMIGSFSLFVHRRVGKIAINGKEINGKDTANCNMHYVFTCIIVINIR